MFVSPGGARQGKTGAGPGIRGFAQAMMSGAHWAPVPGQALAAGLFTRLATSRLACPYAGFLKPTAKKEHQDDASHGIRHCQTTGSGVA
jgi:hypothetical protein